LESSSVQAARDVSVHNSFVGLCGQIMWPVVAAGRGELREWHGVSSILKQDACYWDTRWCASIAKFVGSNAHVLGVDEVC